MNPRNYQFTILPKMEPKKEEEKKRKMSIKNETTENESYNTGRWSQDEHLKFIDGILKYGNEWKKVQEFIKTRSSNQARSHAQKFFLRIKKNLAQNDKQ